MLEKIQNLCKMKGITLSKLERELNFSRGSLYKWDTNSPSVDKVQKVADYFKVSIDFLLGRGEIYDIGHVIRKEREEQGLTIKELSNEVGVAEEELCRYESDDIPISGYLAEKISNVFGLSFLGFLNKYGLYDEYIRPEFGGDADKQEAYNKAVDADALNDVRDDKIQTIAAHHDGEDWTEEELEEIENFKKYVLSKRKNK